MFCAIDKFFSGYIYWYFCLWVLVLFGKGISIWYSKLYSIQPSQTIQQREVLAQKIGYSESYPKSPRRNSDCIWFVAVVTVFQDCRGTVIKLSQIIMLNQIRIGDRNRIPQQKLNSMVPLERFDKPTPFFFCF